jgi:hypothetical protein
MVDIGFEEGGADLLHRVADVGLGDGALAAELAEDAGKAVGESFEHGGYLSGEAGTGLDRSRCGGRVGAEFHG